MLLLEWIVALLAGAVGLTLLAQRVGAPYPAFLALGGTALALMPSGPDLTLEPELALALFVAPVIVNSAYTTSQRDLRENWLQIALLVIVCVALTAGAVAIVARALVPDLPWAAAIALGAIVAPPDAAAASSILRQVHLPYRLSTILGGESLLNDASALFLYRLAIGWLAAGGMHSSFLATSFVLVLPLSLLTGWLAAQVAVRTIGRIRRSAPSIVMQFCVTFGLWTLAERLNLSGVLTLVAFATVVANRGPAQFAVRMRLPTAAVWDTVDFLLNVLAFVLIGLQVRPILAGMDPDRIAFAVSFALAILLVCILTRIGWVLTYRLIRAPLGRIGRLLHMSPKTSGVKGGLIVGWCGMRGIVTLAAAFALPDGTDGTIAFPHRRLILLTAFVVVLGTLLIQGLTLKPLLRWIALKDDDPVGLEIGRTRNEISRAAVAAIAEVEGPAADGLRAEYAEILRLAQRNVDVLLPTAVSQKELRLSAIAAGRTRLHALRRSGAIGHEAFIRIESELDYAELHARAL